MDDKNHPATIPTGQTGTLFDIKGFALHDGPGIRTTVFLKGCPLRCLWCHNPEGLSPVPQLCYRENGCLHCGKCLVPCTHPDCQPYERCLHICPSGCLTVAGWCTDSVTLAEKLAADKDVFAMSGGGVTFSGGEPLLQWAFVGDTAGRLREMGIHTAMETCGYAAGEPFAAVVDVLDYVIMDVKLADPALHRKYTGVDNTPILANLAYLQSCGKPYEIRTPLIPGITDTAENLLSIERLIGNAKWEKLPYNGLAGAKYKHFGMTFGMDTENRTPE